MYTPAFSGENDEREEDYENMQHTCTHKRKWEPGGGNVWRLPKEVGDEINVTK